MSIDFQDAAARLKTLAEAEACQRQSLPEYTERTSLENIPLLAIDIEQHELEGGQLTGVWCLNHSALDQFSSEFLEFAANLGRALPSRPRTIDPLTFLLHNVSMFLWNTEDRQDGGFRYLKLLIKPLPDGRSIKVRQIVSLIKAVELYSRHLAFSAITGRRQRELQGIPEPPWQLVEKANLTPGFQEYPKWIHQPDGRHRIVSTREQHIALFTADWITRGIVTTQTDIQPVPDQNVVRPRDLNGEATSGPEHSTSREPVHQKGNMRWLQKMDGARYESVDFPTAEKYAGISSRRRQQLINEGVFKVVGVGHRRRIVVESLLQYCPPTEDAK